MSTCMRVLAVLCVATLPVGVAVAAAPEDVAITITEAGFSPLEVEVKQNQKVVWTNLAKSDHTVTARDKAPADGAPLFDSGPIKPGATFEHTFTKEGSYEYACTMDPSMTGKVVVKVSP